MTENATAALVPHSPVVTEPVFVRAGGRIVVGVDGSPESRQALRTAARIAELTGADLDVLAVCEIPSGLEFPAAGLDGWNPRAQTEATLENVLQEVFATHRPPALSTAIRFGNPAKEILQEAHDAALIVIGNRGHGAFTGLLLGSVSIKCASAAPCPVLIVHAPVDTGSAATCSTEQAVGSRIAGSDAGSTKAQDPVRSRPPAPAGIGDRLVSGSTGWITLLT
jgi:nucleotide-binding universal stress UspA family protein